MPYLGRQGQFGIRQRFQYLASAGDTSVSGADANGVTMTFSDGLYIDVFLNGVKLKAGEDYNTNTANTVAGISAMNSNDEVEVIAYDAVTVTDTVSAADGGTFSGAVTMNGNNTVGGNLAVTGTTNLTGAATLGSTLTTSGLITASSGIKIANDGNIGSAGDADSISISSAGVVTLTQTPDIPLPSFRANLGASQTGVSDATLTKIQFNVEDWDTHGYYDNTTNYRFTPLIAGYYLIVASVAYNGTGISQTAIQIYKNGDLDGGQEGTSDYYSYSQNAVGVLEMNGSSDYLEIFAYANVSSGTVTFLGGSYGSSSTFSATLLRRPV